MNVILIVEDLSEEQRKAKDAVAEAGFKSMVAGTRQDAFRLWEKMSEHIIGIVTDIHLPQDADTDKGNPNGLSVLSKAVDRKVYVSVCSDLDHHYAYYAEDVINTFSELAGYEIPYTLDRKDWSQAVSNLVFLTQNHEV
jgi:hypothetical protein